MGPPSEGSCDWTQVTGMSYTTLLTTSALQRKRIREIPHTAFFLLWGVCFEGLAYALLAQRFGFDVFRYFTVSVCFCMLWQCTVVLCFPFCWITIGCDNCVEPQIITQFSCLFFLSAFCCLLFAPFCYSHVVFTLLLCVSLGSLCS